MKTLIEILTLATDHLEQKGVANPRRQAEELISFAINMPRLQLYLDHDKPLTETELNRCREYILKRAERIPVGYILGSQQFLEAQIQLNPDVLIPRQETEIWVDAIYLNQGTLWDICTGSGCIGISLKKRFPSLNVILSDISEKAITVAAKNAHINGVSVALRTGDLLEPFQGEKADYITCNPPYINEKDYVNLEPEVKAEPKIALAADDEGLAFYKRLCKQLPDYLNPKGKVWLEVGYNQGEIVKNIFNQKWWKKAVLSRDWSGNDRLFLLEFE